MVIKELLSSSSMLCRMMIKLLNFTNHRSKNNDNTATTKKKKNTEKRVKRILYIKNHQAIQTTANKCKYASLHRMYTCSVLWFCDHQPFFSCAFFFSPVCAILLVSFLFVFFNAVHKNATLLFFLAKHFMDNERKFVFIFIVSVVVAVFVITCCIEMARI